MAKTTWDANRTGGGTYEFSQDAEGKYVLNSIGFQKFGKLNLPELKTESKATILPVDTEKTSKQTKQAFGDVKPFYYDQKGGGADSNEQYINEYKIQKDKSLGTEPEPARAWDRGQWGPKPGDTKPMATEKVDTRPAWAKDADARGYENIGKVDTISVDKQQIGRQNVNKVLAAREKKAQSDRFTGMVGPQKPSPYQDAIMRGERGVKYEKPGIPQKFREAKTTALKHVRTASNVLSKAVGFVMDHSIIGTIAGGLVSPEQKQLNERNSSALSSLGYKTRGELGSNIDPGRIAGNPADNVFAGMNAQSMRGNVFRGARKRVNNISNTIENLDKNWSTLKRTNPAEFQAKKERLEKKRDDFKGQIQEAQGKKNQQDIAKGPGALGPAGGGGNGGGGGGRVICTELHSTGEMSTVDWIRDTRFTFKTLTKSHIKGYLFWAVPTVEHMKKYPLYRKIWKHIAQHRANDIAWRLGESKFDLLGRIYAGIGEPTCWLIGKFVSDKQYNELNLKNWRRA